MQDVIGQKFFKWTICGLGGRSKGGSITYKVRCECGFEKEYSLSVLRSGETKQCRSCLTKERAIAAPNLTGNRYGSWLVVEKIRNPKTNKLAYNCKCDCGYIKIVPTGDLKNNKSLGCINCRHKTHGMSKTSTYRVWNDMRNRCFNPKLKNYKNYGGRGITVCDRWNKFDNFLADMGIKPLNLSIDRINNNGNYEPGNCRWATIEEQNGNQRRAKNNKLEREI